jgi:hypothetical protein
MTYGVDFSEADGVAIISLNRREVLNTVDLETARAFAQQLSPLSEARRAAFCQPVQVSTFPPAGTYGSSTARWTFPLPSGSACSTKSSTFSTT